MIIALDLETTGLDNATDSIIEVALIKFDEKTFEIIDTFCSLIHPEIEIPALITNITNISNNDVVTSPKWWSVQDKVEDFIWDFPILGHNTQFDSGFLRSHGVELRNNIELDTFELANFLLLEEKSLSLEALSLSLWFELNGAHRALNDTWATVELFKYLLKEYKKISNKKKIFIQYIAEKTDNTSLAFLFNSVFSHAPKHISDETFVENVCDTMNYKKQHIVKEMNSELDIWDLESFISSQEKLELRENQYKMSQLVWWALAKEEKIVIEAPTGVGKTFAYLLPAILHSVTSGEQVYVSTSTKALQDQIFYKDLSFLSETLGTPFSYTKLKWKSNYIGILAFMNFVNSANTFSRIESTFVLKILFWLSVTQSWELDELDFYWKEYSFLREINADDLGTFSKENTFEKYEFCVNARKRAKKANIVIINNNILFQDIDGDNNILWKVENLILDEAHTLEDVVTQSLKKWFGLQDFEKHLSHIQKIIASHKFTLPHLERQTHILSFEMWIIFDTFQLYLNKKSNNNDIYQNILIQEDFYDIKIDNIDKKWLSNTIQLKITDLLDSFSLLPDKLYLALSKEIHYLDSVVEVVKVLLDNTDTHYIKIVNYNERRWGIILEFTQLNVWNYLVKNLWSRVNSCILTSATLEVGWSFDYLSKMLNLEEFVFHQLQSDFDYQNQALLFIPDDLWNIKNNLSLIVSFLIDFFMIVRWNTLVLFTAFYAIKECYAQATPLLKKEKISLYAQSIWWGKHKLIEAFKKNADNSILVWTDTFWEWIDIPWDDLKYLLIHKVPFMVPSDPIFQARSSMFKNSFMEYSVPKSILKLKQGFWRLIRSKTDTWIVVFLDDRIYSTHWWEILYSAFPEWIKIRKWPRAEFLKILEHKKNR